MLYKPSNPSPYNSVIDADEELTFSVSCISTSDVKKIRLAIKDDTYDYYFPISESVTASCKSSSRSSISIPIGISSTEESDETTTSQLQFEKGYCIKSSGSYTRTDIAAGTLSSIRDKLSNLKQYRWQLRLYQSDDEKSATMNIGYGFVQDIIKYNNSDSLSTRRILKVRPHTNMFMGDTMRELPSDGKNHSHNRDVKNEALKQYYDENVAYYIQVDGNFYKIKDYYYSKTNAYYSNNQWQNITVQTQYDEPLYAYIEVDLKLDTNGELVETISGGAEYTILTNYIDSNEYYFFCRQLGTLKFTDPRITGDDKEVKFVDIDELDANPEDHIYSPTHSNVQIKGSFDSSSSAAINYYKSTLYQVLPNGEDIQIHDSGYVYASEVDCDCKDLLSGNMYKLVITVADIYGNTKSYGAYISPNCDAAVKPTLLSVTPYPKHNSIIIDFGKLLSITGECKPNKKGYSIKAIDGVSACVIEPNNTVVFNKIDGTDKKIECYNPLINMTFKCNGSDVQQIFEFIADDAWHYALWWDRYIFHFSKWHPFRRAYSETDIDYSPYSDTIPPLNDNCRDEIYTDVWDISRLPSSVLNTLQSKIQEETKVKGKRYNVPYLAFEDEKMNGSDYMHSESAAHDFWWHVVVTKNEIHIKCVNPPPEHEWKYSTRW